MYFQNYDMSENASVQVNTLLSLLQDPKWVRQVSGSDGDDVPAEVMKQAVTALGVGMKGYEAGLRASHGKHPWDVMRRAFTEMVQSAISAVVSRADNTLALEMIEESFKSNRSESWLVLLGTQLSTPEEAFSFAHEQAHCCLGSLLTVAEAQKDVAAVVHRIIAALTAPDQLSAEDIKAWWDMFHEGNRELVRSVRLLEPIEEIAANYVALKTVGGEDRKSIRLEVRRVMDKRGLRAAFDDFTATCDAWEVDWQPPDRMDTTVNPLGGYPLRAEVRMSVFLLTEMLCNMTIVAGAFDSSTVSSTALALRPLYANIGKNHQANLDTDMMANFIDEAMASQPEMFGKSLTWALQREHTSFIDLEPVVPKVVLAGTPEYVEPLLYPDPNERDRLTDMVIHESMRQQLQAHSGFICPFSKGQEDCCGRRDEWRQLLMRLAPQEGRHFNLPRCAVH
ncbi:MAG: hypothetical protein NVSMB52_21410 [Chloroflexota bacterium]